MADMMQAVTLRGVRRTRGVAAGSGRPFRTADDVLIRLHAFGINRVEAFLRQGAFGPADLPPHSRHRGGRGGRRGTRSADARALVESNAAGGQIFVTT